MCCAVWERSEAVMCVRLMGTNAIPSCRHSATRAISLTELREGNRRCKHTGLHVCGQWEQGRSLSCRVVLPRLMHTIGIAALKPHLFPPLLYSHLVIGPCAPVAKPHARRRPRGSARSLTFADPSPPTGMGKTYTCSQHYYCQQAAASERGLLEQELPVL